jgi:hypothetical protein
MNDPNLPAEGSAHASRDQVWSVLFAQLVMQQANTALMLLGKVPGPETERTVRDLDAARMFIDQLEMLEVKTKGNLDAQEERLLKQSLTSLRMAFVEAVDADQSAASASSAQTGAPAAAPNPPASAGSSQTSAEEEPRKRFTKKY